MWVFPAIAIAVLVSGVSFIFYLIITYRFTRVPHVATSKKHFDKIFEGIVRHLDKDFSAATFVDLGSGFGPVVFEAERRGFKEMIGYELSPLHCWWSQFKGRLAKSKARFERKNFFKQSIDKIDVIYLFLTHPVVGDVEKKLANEAKPGTIAVVLGDQFIKKDPVEKVLLSKKSEVYIRLYKY